MKKRKYIILTTIISLLIILIPNKIKAQVYTEYIEYSSSYKTTIENKLETINSVYNYIKENLDYINGLGNNFLTRNDYLIFHPTTNFNCDNNSQYNVGLIYTDMTIPSQSVSASFNYVQLTFNCENNIPTTLNSIQTGNNSISFTGSLYGGIFNQFFDYRLAFANESNDELMFNNNSDIFNFIIRNGETTWTVVPGDSIEQDRFAGTLMNYSLPYEEEVEPYCTKTQVLGMFENPSEFTINISAISNVFKEDIQGIIKINYEASEIINSNQWEITDTISENTTGDYELKCSTEEQTCELWFNYIYGDDIDQEINMNFKFKTISGVNMPSFVRLYSCLNNYNDINITYDNVKNTNSGQTTTENKMDNIVGGIGNILNFLNPANLIYIVVPTEQQMQNLLNEMQDKINNKLGILGLPLTIYTRIMNLANTSTQDNWCLSWNGIKVPNFEDYEIIGTGSWCFSQILENEQINTFRNVCINIIGGLILLAFIQYLHNTYNKIIDAPDRDEYQYITTEDVYTVNNETGELTNHVWKKRKTVREKVDK